MKSTEFTIKSENGIHARPAGRLTEVAKKFSSSVTLQKAGNDKEVDAKSIFSVMGLGAKKGEILSVLISGADEEEALIAIKEFLEKEL